MYVCTTYTVRKFPEHWQLSQAPGRVHGGNPVVHDSQRTIRRSAAGTRNGGGSRRVINFERSAMEGLAGHGRGWHRGQTKGCASSRVFRFMFVCPGYVWGDSVAKDGFEINAEWSVPRLDGEWLAGGAMAARHRRLKLACAYPFSARREQPRRWS